MKLHRVVLYLPVYLVAAVTAFLLNNRFALNLDVALLGLLSCLSIALFLRRKGLNIWLCIPAFALCMWEYLEIAVMVVLWSIVGFAP